LFVIIIIIIIIKMLMTMTVTGQPSHRTSTYQHHYLTVLHYSVLAVTYPILQGTETTAISGKYITICNYRTVLSQQKWRCLLWNTDYLLTYVHTY